MVERLFLAVPRGCLQFVIVVFPDHTHLLFFIDSLLVKNYVFHNHANKVLRLARSSKKKLSNLQNVISQMRA